MWYAVTSEGYEFWDYGSHDLEEAKQMLKSQGSGCIAIIDEDDNFCTGEIHFNEI